MTVLTVLPHFVPFTTLYKLSYLSSHYWSAQEDQFSPFDMTSNRYTETQCLIVLLMCSSVCLHDRYDSRDRSPVRYKSRSPLPARSRSRSPVRARSASRERMRTRSASRSPKAVITHRPRERLLGKTPPLPNRSHSSSPQRYNRVHTEMKVEAPGTKFQRERSRSPLAYSSRKIAGAYTPPSPSPQPKVRNSYEKKYSISPVRKRNSPLPKAYALSPDRPQSRGWSRSRSKSIDRKYSSRSPIHKMDNRSSSSTSPPRYGRSPVARENCPPAAIKRTAGSPDNGKRKVLQPTTSPSVQKNEHSPVQRYHRSYASTKHSRSPEVAKRERSPIYHRVNSPAMHRQSPSLRSRTSRQHASPETTRSKLESYRSDRSSPVTQTGMHWPQATKKSEQDRKRSPVVSSMSLARNGRSPSNHGHNITRSDRVRSSAGGGQLESSPVSRDRRSPRRRR